MLDLVDSTATTTGVVGFFMFVCHGLGRSVVDIFDILLPIGSSSFGGSTLLGAMISPTAGASSFFMFCLQGFLAMLDGLFGSSSLFRSSAMYVRFFCSSASSIIMFLALLLSFTVSSTF
jgi:hypothetical protein